MADYRDLIEEEHEQHPVWFGIIAKDAADFTALVPVILPDWDEHLQWGPCRWQARNTIDLPQKGDRCLVIFDNRRDPWVTAWWPYG